ncbi:MAG: hypothetical protein KDJ52_04985 [Anaerolineae bacterium]|nr:hypothetical protein [Anaerolineae bacterium]
MTDPTIDRYAQLLLTFPPENIVTSNDPAYANTEAFGGCTTCTQGTPCRTRIDEDVDEILHAAHLPDSEKLACLQWMIAEGCSSLTHRMDEMVEALLDDTVIVVEADGSDVAVLAYDPASPQQALLTVMSEEAARRELPLSDVSLRFVVDKEARQRLNPIIPNTA